MTSGDDCIESLRRIGHPFHGLWCTWKSGCSDLYRPVVLVGVHDHFGGRCCHPIKQSCSSHAKCAARSGATVLVGGVFILRYSLFISDLEMLWTVKTTIAGRVFLKTTMLLDTEYFVINNSILSNFIIHLKSKTSVLKMCLN